tara:strand:+ start:980 stop:1282 length:303 start_codon:yes stop_codon:yes gene_type:complete
MANTYKSVNMDLVGGSTQPVYSSSFLIADWSLNGTVYEIEVLTSVHGRGVSTQVQVFEKIGTDHVEVIVDILVQSNGNIIIKIDQTPDLRFDGKVTIIGE